MSLRDFVFVALWEPSYSSLTSQRSHVAVQFLLECRTGSAASMWQHSHDAWRNPAAYLDHLDTRNGNPLVIWFANPSDAVSYFSSMITCRWSCHSDPSIRFCHHWLQSTVIRNLPSTDKKYWRVYPLNSVAWRHLNSLLTESGMPVGLADPSSQLLTVVLPCDQTYFSTSCPTRFYVVAFFWIFRI